jgi:hypothetical protein
VRALHGRLGAADAPGDAAEAGAPLMRPDLLLELDSRTPDVTDAPPLDPVHEALLRAEFRERRALQDYAGATWLLAKAQADRAVATREAWWRGFGAGAVLLGGVGVLVLLAWVL